MKRLVPLEQAAEKVCNENSKPPLIFQIPPEEGRERLEKAQDSPVFKYPAEVHVLEVTTNAWGCVKVFVVVPDNICDVPNIIYYIHGAGWVFGSFHTHDKLVRELAARTNSIIIFPEYSRSPEAKYPVALEQCYDILSHVPEILNQIGCQANLETLTIAGDSVGGNMATIISIMAKQKCGPKIHKQLLYYPVTDACFNTHSYCQFAVDYYLYRAGMMWFWNQYTTSKRERNEITTSPLRASKEDLEGLPDAMILTGEADVLRDEGECYARKLRAAGVEVTAMRFQAIIHDFVMLNALDQTQACRAAMDASTQWINRKNYPTE
ncbi:MAG: alpha/beta hydrolase [Cellulosilyticum sp.]|nr:alpha/beta hydrolase [Cellulosilyticum sp.]